VIVFADLRGADGEMMVFPKPVETLPPTAVTPTEVWQAVLASL